MKDDELIITCMIFLEVSREDIASNGSGVDTVFAPSQLHDNGASLSDMPHPCPRHLLYPFSCSNGTALKRAKVFSHLARSTSGFNIY